MTNTATDTEPPIRCPSCRADAFILESATPVYCLVNGHRIVRVVVADEETELKDRATCRRCGTQWQLDHEPNLGDWPAWQVGW